MSDSEQPHTSSMGNKKNLLNDRKTEQFRKLFIGGLSAKTDEEGLKAFFSVWGEIIDVVVMKDKRSGRSRGFGFVTYLDPASVDEAQFNRPHEIDGKVVETKRAMSREDANNPEAHMTVNKLFVGGLRKEVTSEDMCQYFMRFGHVIECEVVTWRETGDSRGFGFVTFDDYDPVDKAVLYKPHQIGSSLSDVKKALSKTLIGRLRDPNVSLVPPSLPTGACSGSSQMIQTPQLTQYIAQPQPHMLASNPLNGPSMTSQHPSYSILGPFSPAGDSSQQQHMDANKNGQMCCSDWANPYLSPWMAMAMYNGISNPVHITTNMGVPSNSHCQTYRTNPEPVAMKNGSSSGGNNETISGLLNGLMPTVTPTEYLMTQSNSIPGTFCRSVSPRLATA